MIELTNSSVGAQRLYLDYDKMAVGKTVTLLEFFNCPTKDLRTLLEGDQRRIYERAS